MAKHHDTPLTTLAYALLGLLARGEKSGYDLAQGLKVPVGFFWHAKHSQIYPELAKLESLGLVKFKKVMQIDRPDKKVYSLTAVGKKILKVWLEAPLEVPKVRDEFLLKAYSIWLAEPEVARTMMRDHAEAHAAQLADYERKLEHVKREAGVHINNLSSPWFGLQAVLMRGIGYEREYVAWCEWVIQQFTASNP
jgi:DNA-binding PadR family transcriptional regulator